MGELIFLDYLIIFLLFSGVVFSLFEVFAPGFGVFGILGIVSTILAIFVTVVFDRPSIFLYLEILAIFYAGAMLFYLFTKFKGKEGLIHNDVIKPMDKGVLDKYIGLEGVAKSILRPVGIVVIDDEEVEAVASMSFIDKAERVKVVRVTDGKLIV